MPAAVDSQESNNDVHTGVLGGAQGRGRPGEGGQGAEQSPLLVCFPSWVLPLALMDPLPVQDLHGSLSGQPGQWAERRLPSLGSLSTAFPRPIQLNTYSPAGPFGQALYWALGTHVTKACSLYCSGCGSRHSKICYISTGSVAGGKPLTQAPPTPGCRQRCKLGHPGAGMSFEG